MKKALIKNLEQNQQNLVDYLKDMVTVPAFVYNFIEDRYLFTSQATHEFLGAHWTKNGLRSWVNRIHPEDFPNFLGAYQRDMERLSKLRKGDPPFAMEVIRVRIASSANEWIPTVIKVDVVGFDSTGMASTIFGLLLTEETVGKADKKLLNRVNREWASLLKVQRKHFGKKRLKKDELAITVREWDVLSLIRNGKSTKQIAVYLKISPHTVESHRKKLLTKFDAHTSAELVAKAAEKYKW